MKLLVIIAPVRLGVCAWAAGRPVFEDEHVVKIRLGRFGPRGMPGDIIELKDGRLLPAYTRGGMKARTCTDKAKT